MIETIVTSSVLIVVLVILRRIWKGKISLRLQYALWLLVAIRLLVPLPVVETAWSVMNVMTPVVEKTEAFGNREIDIPTRLADGQGADRAGESGTDTGVWRRGARDPDTVDSDSSCAKEPSKIGKL